MTFCECNVLYEGHSKIAWTFALTCPVLKARKWNLYQRRVLSFVILLDIFAIWMRHFVQCNKRLRYHRYAYPEQSIFLCKTRWPNCILFAFPNGYFWQYTTTRCNNASMMLPDNLKHFRSFTRKRATFLMPVLSTPKGKMTPFERTNISTKPIKWCHGQVNTHIYKQN